MNELSWSMTGKLFPKTMFAIVSSLISEFSSYSAASSFD